MTNNDSRTGNKQKLFFLGKAQKDMFWHVAATTCSNHMR